MIEPEKLKEPAVVHHANDRPEKPPVGMLHDNPVKGFTEMWDGQRWVPQVSETDRNKTR